MVTTLDKKLESPRFCVFGGQPLLANLRCARKGDLRENHDSDFCLASWPHCRRPCKKMLRSRRGRKIKTKEDVAGRQVGRFAGGGLGFIFQVASCMVSLMRPAPNIQIKSAPKWWQNLAHGGEGNCEGPAPRRLVHVKCRP